MAKCNISKSILTISTPGTHLVSGNDALARTVARATNEYASALKKRRPNQFGFFASLPSPDIEGCLSELSYALDTLSADGVVFLTNAHGVYLGDKRLDPVFAELNRRKATVFMHPTTPCMAHGEAAVPLTLFPRSTYEFFFDTARAVMNLFASGTVSRCPDITFIVPHLGGAFPPLINRFSRVAPLLGLPGIDPSLSPEWVKERLNTQFYFDTAGWAFEEQIRGLLQYVGVDRVVYGSDFPWTPMAPVVGLSQEHDRYLPVVFEREEDRRLLCTGNARRLLGMEKEKEKEKERREEKI